MNNIVDFRVGRTASRSTIPVSQSGARILFFTGVRYTREVEDIAAPFMPEASAFREVAPMVQQASSEVALDRAGC